MKYADLLVTSLKAAVEKNPVQDMGSWWNFTTFDLTGEFAFGEAFNCLESGGKYHFFVKTIFDGIVIGLRLGQFERYGIFSMLAPLIPKSAMKARTDMMDYTKEIVDRRIEHGYDPSKSDALNYLLQNKNPADQLSKPSLYENGIILVVGGSETTATLLTGVLWFLCTNPNELQTVQREIRSMFPTDGDITGKRVNEAQYMIAVLTETLRIFPPSGFGFPRKISAPEGQTVAGHHVPFKVREHAEVLTPLFMLY